MYFVALLMQSCLKTETAAHSSHQCSVSLTGSPVNMIHEENQPSALFVSSSTSCVPTSENHQTDISSSGTYVYNTYVYVYM